MKVRWRKLCTKTLIWLAAEIILNLIGLDTIADYSEFVFDDHRIFHLTKDYKSYIIFDNFEHFLIVGEKHKYRF